MSFSDLKNAAKTKELFAIEWIKNSGITNEMVPTVKKRGWERKQILCSTVLTTFFQIVIDDCIDNDVVFYAPIRNFFKLYVKRKNETEMRRIFKNPGIYGDVDMIKTNGSVYSVRLTVPYIRPYPEKEVRITRTDYARIIDKANSGYVYCGAKVVKYDRYIELMANEFPTLDDKMIKKIVKEGCRMIVHYLVNGKPILMSNPRIKFRAYVYTPKWFLLTLMANK